MSIIIKPIVTEKVTKQSEVLNQFGFVVDRKANKVQIKKAVEAAYGVTVLSVNTMNVRPDRTTKYTKSGLISGKTNAYKKAIVQVQEGETIDFLKAFVFPLINPLFVYLVVRSGLTFIVLTLKIVTP